MDEDFLDVTENSHHIAVIFLIVIIIFAVGGYFLVFRKSYFSLKTVEVEIGSTLSTDIEDYLKGKPERKDNYRLDTKKVNTSEVGEYEYSVTHNKITKTGTIKVIDTTAPIFTLQEMTIEEGSTDYYLGDLLATCEDLSKPCLINIKDSKDEDRLKNVGTHEVEIEVADLYGNKTTGKATIKVVAKGEYIDPRSQDLEYASNSKKIENFNGTVYKKLEKALNPDSSEAHGEMNSLSYVDIETYIKENHPGYKLVASEFIELYNKSSFIIGYSIMLTISNGTETTVYIDPAKAHNLPSTTEDISTDGEESD